MINKKKKKYYLIFSSLLLVLLIVSSTVLWSMTNITYIDDSDVPLASVKKYKAVFYLNMTNKSSKNVSYKSCKKLGAGYIQQRSSYENLSTKKITSLVLKTPDLSDYVDDAHEVRWQRIYSVANTYRVIGKVYAKQTTSDTESGMSLNTASTGITCTSVSAMKKGNYSAGTTVITQSYNSTGDNGGATYTISKTPSTTADDFLTVSLDNGLYANLQYGTGSLINVACAGIFPSTNISQRLNYVSSALSGKVSGIVFNEGTYYIDQKTILTSLNYHGNGTTLAVSPKYSTDYFGMITTDTLPAGNIVNLTNLNFYCKPSSQSKRFGKETTLLYLKNITSCTIDRCSFLAETDSASGGFSPVDLVWFQSSKADNITVKNCSFRNLTGAYYTNDPGKHLVGGCLWYSGMELSDSFQNFTVTACDFETTNSDEIIAIWHGSFSDIQINDCTFKNSGAVKSDNFISMYNGDFQKAGMSECTFTINTPISRVIKTNKLSKPSSFAYVQNQFIYTNAKTTASNSYEVFWFGTDNEGYNGLTNVTLNNNQITSTNDTIHIGALISCLNTTGKNIVAKENTSSVNLDWGILNTKFASNIHYDIQNNNITNAKRVNQIDTLSSSSILLTGNTLNTCSSYIANSCYMDYTFSGNTVKNQSGNILIYAANLSKSNSSITFVNTNNKYTVTPTQFSSNNKIAKTAVVVTK